MKLNKRPVKPFRKSKVFGTVPIKSALFLRLSLRLIGDLFEYKTF